jgi:ABC-type transport system involved in cytochrome c biogenesis permease subunit
VWPPTVFAAAALTHTFVIGMQTMEVGHPPFVGATGAVSGFVWLLALVYLYTEFTTEERAMGVLIAPLCALLQVIPAASGQVAPRPPVLESPLFSIHVTTLLSAYAASRWRASSASPTSCSSRRSRRSTSGSSTRGCPRCRRSTR